MTDWTGRTVDGAFAVQLQGPVLKALDRLCSAAGRSETGGILIGRYSADRSVAIVREATPPPSDSRRGPSWFVRGVNGLRDMLARKWHAEDRTHYVGEWHFHPIDHIDPSEDDFRQMLEIAVAKAYECKDPLLIILGASRSEGLRPLRAFVCPSGRTPLEFVPVPAQTDAARPATEGAS